MTYSYEDGGLYYFMDNETYEQIPLNESEPVSYTHLWQCDRSRV